MRILNRNKTMLTKRKAFFGDKQYINQYIYIIESPARFDDSTNASQNVKICFSDLR